MVIWGLVKTCQTGYDRNIGHLVTNLIHSTPGVTETLTCLVVET
jgi:hypothetical protein